MGRIRFTSIDAVVIQDFGTLISAAVGGSGKTGLDTDWYGSVSRENPRSAFASDLFS
jgi:hypothetical protein